MNEVFDTAKLIWFLDVIEVTMIAFEAFIVVADNSSTRIAIEQSIFVVMGAPWHGFENTPDHHFDNSPVVEQESIAVDQFRIHVGNYANIFECNPAVKPSVNCDSSVLGY